MATNANKPPSLKDFDYFAADESLVTQDDVPAGAPAQEISAGPSLQRNVVTLALLVAVVTFTGWFLYGFREYAGYAFAEPTPPLRMGSVSTMVPADLTHNTYVEVTGITEHRGLTQKAIRGLSLRHEAFWYFRLVGSRGVFIETPPDMQRYGPATEVHVAGRAVDPDRDPLYRSLLRSYQDTFATELSPSRRLIQVDLRPGEHRTRYVVGASVLFTMAMGALAMAIGMVSRIVKQMR